MSEDTEAEVIGLDEVTGWPFEPSAPQVPFLLSGGSRTWAPRTPFLFPVHKGRLVESIDEILKHPARSRGQRGRLSAAEVERLDAAYERAVTPRPSGEF